MDVTYKPVALLLVELRLSSVMLLARLNNQSCVIGLEYDLHASHSRFREGAAALFMHDHVTVDGTLNALTLVQRNIQL